MANYGNVLSGPIINHDTYSWTKTVGGTATSAGTMDVHALAQERARYKRHLEAIFATDCVCEDATCPACIAEHALYYNGDHELVQR